MVNTYCILKLNKSKRKLKNYDSEEIDRKKIKNVIRKTNVKAMREEKRKKYKDENERKKEEGRGEREIRKKRRGRGHC